MKYILFLFVVIFAISCDNELQLVAEKKEVPVVYGIIDQADTAQYIRVERTFVDTEIAPDVIAQNPDSLYYEGITVKLVTENGNEYILDRVDGNLEGYQREDGAFASSPNYLYKIKTEEISLVENEVVELRIEGIEEGKVITASTEIIEPPFLAHPQDDALMGFEPNKAIGVGWNPRDNNVVFTAIFHINITELENGEERQKRLTWVVTSSTDKRSLEAEGDQFFAFLADKLEADANVSRILNSLEFELITGNSDIDDYIRVGQANLGITSSGEIPVFSNLSEGLGVYAATHTHRRINLSLTGVSRDSLMNSRLTRDLNFQ